MTDRYVGAGGSDGNNGTSWATRKLTLNGVEDTPIVAGDTVYVGPGIYRETLTCDVGGTLGNVITYIGDYTGANTDGVGGIVRITGSDDDKVTARNECIYCDSHDYRTFQGFVIDMGAGVEVRVIDSGNFVLNKCIVWGHSDTWTIQFSGTDTGNTVQNCVIIPHTLAFGVRFYNGTTVNDSGHIVQNCIFLGGYFGVQIDAVGGVLVRNSTFLFGRSGAVTNETALAAGQVTTVNNCIIAYQASGVNAQSTSEFVENYNDFYAVQVARTNVNVGANSKTYPPLFDSRWLMELVK